MAHLPRNSTDWRLRFQTHNHAFIPRRHDVNRKLAVAVLALLGLTFAQTALAQSDATSLKALLDKVRAGWAKRFDRIHSVQCRWKTQWRQQKLSFFRSDGTRDFELTPDEIKKYSSEYVTYSQESYFSSTGKKMRYDEKGMRPAYKAVLHSFETRYSYDGSIRETFVPLQNPFPCPVGRIEACGRGRAVPVASPLVWAYCSDPAAWQIDLNAVERIPDRTRPAADVVLRSTRLTDGGMTQTWWLDSKQDYSIVRMSLSSKGGKSLSFYFDYDYKRDPLGIWVPQRWLLTRIEPSGELITVAESNVTELKLNPTLRDDEFPMRFPPGTVVMDTRKPPETAHLIVLPDGTMRVRTRNDHNTRE